MKQEQEFQQDVAPNVTYSLDQYIEENVNLILYICNIIINTLFSIMIKIQIIILCLFLILARKVDQFCPQNGTIIDCQSSPRQNVCGKSKDDKYMKDFDSICSACNDQRIWGFNYRRCPHSVRDDGQEHFVRKP
ncbi:hypothetical protein pb186bvf_013240 [Paramecium bursaria]